MGYTVRQARTADVPGIRGLMDANVGSGRLLGKATVTLYEDVQEFWVAEQEPDGLTVGCGALHVLWEDLAEIRTIAVRADCQGQGIGRRLCSLMEAVLAFEPKSFASDRPIRKDIDGLLGSLVRMGVAEAHRLEGNLCLI